MICPHCGKETIVPKKTQKNKEIYDRFLTKWNKCKIVQHRKITTRMKKAIDKVIKNADYPLVEVFLAFENYAMILNSPDYYWSHKWTMEDFLNRGLHKFVNEAEPFDNNKKEFKTVTKNICECFDCGGY